MVGVERPAILIAPAHPSCALEGLLVDVVAGLAQGLQGAVEEPVRVALVRLYVVRNGGCCGAAAPCAVLAQGAFQQLQDTALAPCWGVVQVVVVIPSAGCARFWMMTNRFRVYPIHLSSPSRNW
jgi:hypothetical protein